MKKIVLIFVSLLFISGCSYFSQETRKEVDDTTKVELKHGLSRIEKLELDNECYDRRDQFINDLKLSSEYLPNNMLIGDENIEVFYSPAYSTCFIAYKVLVANSDPEFYKDNNEVYVIKNPYTRKQIFNEAVKLGNQPYSEYREQSKKLELKFEEKIRELKE